MNQIADIVVIGELNVDIILNQIGGFCQSRRGKNGK